MLNRVIHLTEDNHYDYTDWLYFSLKKMLNGQLNDFGAETHLTQVASYFDIVDNAVKTGDTNKRYSISMNVSTAPSPPIAEGSWTSIHISPTADNMCDLTNSYIVVNMELTPTIYCNDAYTTKCLAGARNPAVWIGFKDALDAIEQYQIVANGQAIYTQPHAIEESYITNLATPDTVRSRDIFQKATVEQIYNRSDCVMTGGVIDITNEKNAVAFPFTPAKPMNIKLKIDIRRILPLSAIKYLPAFVGNLELKVKFSTAGMVVLPMPIDDFAKDPAWLHMTSEGLNNITTCFLPVNEEFNAYVGMKLTTKSYLTAEDTATALKIPTVKYEVKTLHVGLGKMTVTECKSCLCCFGIDDGIYQSLIQRYTGQSLSFPTQTLTFQAMNGIMGGEGQLKVDLALTSTPRFVDTIFVMFPYNSKYRTVYINPLFDNFRLTMGGYGSCPDMPISSYGPYFYEMLQNAFNMNSDLMGLNEDVMRSAILNPELKNWPQQTQGKKANDVSNFVIAIPTSTDCTFQQGQTSAAPITYEFKGTLNPNSMFANKGVSSTPLMGFLKDSIIAIQLRPNGPPIVAIDEYDITSPAGQ